MRIFLAADHRGFTLKEQLKKHLLGQSNDQTTKLSHEIIDCGAAALDPADDYVDFATKAVNPTTWQSEDRAILICGSGHGMDMAANRFSHIRAILGYNHEVVIQGRQHEDANVLVIAADWTTIDQTIERVSLFLSTPFSQEERHQRRLDKLCHLPHHQ